MATDRKNPWASRVKMTPEQSRAKKALDFAIAQEDRYMGSVFANAIGQRQHEAKVREAHEACKRLGMGIEHGL